MMLKLHGVIYSDIGHVRQNNEDNFYYQGYFRKGFELNGTFSKSFTADQAVQIYAISDGIGGMAKGEIASRIAVSELSVLERELLQAKQNSDLPGLRNYLADRNSVIVDRNKDQKDTAAQMGATISILQFRDKQVNLANMGDSAVFHFRDGQLRQISRDDTPAARLRSLGYITSEEAKNHPLRHGLENYLGKNTGEKEPDVYTVSETEIREGDLFLLCSDGISGALQRDVLTNVLIKRTPIEEKKEELVNLALAAGSADNLTLILLEIESAERTAFVDQNVQSNAEQSKVSAVDETKRFKPVASTPQPAVKVRPVPVAKPQSSVKPVPAPVIRHKSLSQEQLSNYEKAREEARKRQLNMKQVPKTQEVPEKAGMSNPETGSKGSVPSNEQLSRRAKAEMYDRRYRDTSKTATKKSVVVEVNQANTSDSAHAKKRRRGFGQFIRWLLFLILFILIGYGIVWLLVHGRQFLPF